MDNTSDSDSVNSDEGIRYKTNSVRSNQDVKKYDSIVEENQSFGPSLPLDLHKNISIGPALPPKPQEKIAEVVGPMLPPHLQKTKELDIEESKVIGPALPPHLMKSQESVSPPQTLGPSLPPHLQKPLQNNTSIGPALPPHLQSKNLPKETPESKCFGPSLPDHLRQQLAQVAELQSEEEDVYGPVPVGFSGSKAHIELEERALQMKIDMLNPKGEKEPTREEWMLELPAAKATHFGLGPRQFRAKEAPDMSDRSSWTDTPEDRSKKKAKKETKEVDLQKEAEIKEMKRRDKEQEAIVKKSKRSKESLVDMHMKKMKKDKDDSGPAERRPFSREVDLQVNRFDEAAKKAVLKKAQLLDTRFSAGQSKFL
ncbi:GPALPP motifs-containing protein 1 [Diabrotica virgifera virgifera]|uniref:GPALPP motifs-containing protein 1 n=1 Tax=Diabrotica virgifera virgifera TaxID=50390 RepID=A0A6P7FVV2_DIAVI|nr:GPALPP motifs-containing protein 1 [Diabrotica virgifera virgifera]XP_050498414.1 GPALPP motifs-containing protein 1 [Diabrotica virgifera virgifera]